MKYTTEQWVVTKYDDFGEPLMRELVEVPMTAQQLLEELGEALC